MKRLFLSLFSLLILTGSVFVTIWGMNLIRKGKAAARWQTTEARITHSEIVKTYSNVDMYGPKIEYEYAVGNKKLNGENLAFGTTGESRDYRAWAEKYLGKYPVGKTVTVFFNPADPQESVLEPGATHMAYGMFIGGLVAILFVLRVLYIVNFNDPRYGTPAQLRKRLEGLKD